MEEKPIRFERRDDQFGAVFEVVTEEFRPSSEEDARSYYNSIIDKRANLLLEQDSIIEKLEEYERDIELFGSVFDEYTVKVIEDEQEIAAEDEQEE